jgi:hypothetical protein
MRALLFWLLSSTYSQAIRVYDCAHENVSITELDLLQPADCPTIAWDFSEPENITLQLLQTDGDVTITAVQCLITISADVTYCGYTDYITYSSVPTRWMDVQNIDTDACLTAAEKGAITVDSKVFKVKKNVVHQETWFSHGDSTAGGHCKGEAFTSNNVYFRRHYELSRIEILIRDMPGNYRPELDEIYFPLISLTSNFAAGKDFDGRLGTLAWDSVTLPCNDTISQVYNGQAETRRRKHGSNMGSIIMVATPQSEQYIGLVLKSPLLVCERHCHNTQLKEIVVCLAKDNYDPLYNATFQATFVSNHEDFGAQMAYQFFKDRLQMHRSFHEVAIALCNLKRQIFHNKLQAVASGNGPYALLDLYGPGHSFVVVGAVAYITTCVELAATPASYPNCTAEIPLSVNNSRYFADPFNFVLHTVATILPCSTITPVKWKIAGE